MKQGWSTRTHGVAGVEFQIVRRPDRRIYDALTTARSMRNCTMMLRHRPAFGFLLLHAGWPRPGHAGGPAARPRVQRGVDMGARRTPDNTRTFRDLGEQHGGRRCSARSSGRTRTCSRRRNSPSADVSAQIVENDAMPSSRRADSRRTQPLADPEVVRSGTGNYNQSAVGATGTIGGPRSSPIRATARFPR